MAVYDRSYKRYEGRLTPPWARFLVLPRYSFQEVFKSKLFLFFLALCFLPTLVFAGMVYILHNTTFLELIRAISQSEGPSPFDIGESHFLWFVVVQGALAFLVAVVVAPSLVSADLRDNALPLYLSRPFSRKEYVAGKLSVLLAILSALTWIPALAIFSLQGYLHEGWLAENFWIGGAIVLSAGSWVVLLSLLGLAVAAWVRWKAVARITLFAVFFISAFVGKLVSVVLRTDRPVGDLLSIPDAFFNIYVDLFRVAFETAMPAWTGWLTVLALSAFSLLLLARKIRAHEVIK